MSKESQREAKRRWYYKNLDRARECGRRGAKKYREKNLELVRQREHSRRKLNRENGELWFTRVKKYDLTLDQFHAMFETQNERCAICQEVLELSNGRNQSLHIDHDHVTNKVRGLLCKQCNVTLPHWFRLDKFRDRILKYARAA